MPALGHDRANLEPFLVEQHEPNIAIQLLHGLDRLGLSILQCDEMPLHQAGDGIRAQDDGRCGF